MGKLLKFRNEEGRILPKNAGILNFIEDVFAFALILVLTVSAITIKIMQDNLHMQVLNADAILVSQTVTQKDVHIKNLTELIELMEAEGLRDKMIVCCGGPRITHELAKELGFDAGFGMGTYADDVASFVSQEFVKRHNK